MYLTHFGLRQRPFPVTPDSDAYYPSTGHEQALAQLLNAVTEEEGLALLAGPPGTGKTLLCHCLLERLPEEVAYVYLTHGRCLDCAGFLQAVLYDLSLPYQGRTEQELRLALTEHLLANYAAGVRMLLLVDEAQHLATDLLEELRLLGNLEGPRGRALQVILVGQPSLFETLDRPELAILCQRLAVRTRLEALGVHEAADYLLHHLRRAGGRPERIMTDEALEIMARGAQGIPRLLNRVAHHALSLSHSAELSQVDAEAALESLQDLGLAPVYEGAQEVTAPVVAVAATDNEEPAQPEATHHAVLTLKDETKPEDGPDPKPPRDSARLRRLFAPPRRPA